MAQRPKSLIDGLLYLLNSLAALALLLSYLAYYISPQLLSFFSFLSLGYPILLFINTLFVIYWLIRFKRKAFLSILCIAIGYLHVSRSVGFSPTQKVVNTEDRLKVMTFNLRLQNHYKWIDSENIAKEIYEEIKQEDPDVLMVQEYRKHWPEAGKKLGYKYAHYLLNNKGTAGQAVFSKYPIIDSKNIRFEGDTAGSGDFQQVDIEFKNQKIRFLNIHLASVGLEREDYKLLENPDTENQEELEKGVRSIAKSLSNAFVRRSIQTKSVVKAVTESPYPIVLAGDFNDVPQSHAYHQVDLKLEDSFMESGGGLAKTYAKGPIPLRIDYIFHSDELRAFNFKVGKKELSDHFPVITELEFVK